MKVLVTGSNGQVGYCLVQQLRQQNADFLALDRDQLDITQRQAVWQTVSDYRPNVIINAAAHTAVDKAESEAEQAFAINRDGAAYLAEAAQQIGAAMLHISTDYVFDGQATQPYTETDATAPQGVYGQSKLAGEQAVLAACSRSIILRTAWVFGEHGHNFVKTMLRLGRERDSLGIVSDQHGAPTYAGDIAAALLHIAHHITQGKPTEYGIYHFSGKPYVSWYQFAEAIFQQAQQQGILANTPQLFAIATPDYPTPAKRPANSCLQLDKIQQAFGISPSDWQQALTQLAPYAS